MYTLQITTVNSQTGKQATATVQDLDISMLIDIAWDQLHPEFGINATMPDTQLQECVLRNPEGEIIPAHEWDALYEKTYGRFN